MKIKKRLQKVILDLEMIYEDGNPAHKHSLEDIIRDIKNFERSVK